jgi:SpoVK/Ycf46/Vps4 family AAA+-type ATPase
VTNRKHVIDPAVLRPGRFDVHLTVPLPDLDARREIVSGLLSRMPHAISDAQVQRIAEQFQGRSSSDVINHIREAATRAIRAHADRLEHHHFS